MTTFTSGLSSYRPYPTNPSSPGRLCTTSRSRAIIIVDPGYVVALLVNHRHAQPHTPTPSSSSPPTPTTPVFLTTSLPVHIYATLVLLPLGVFVLTVGSQLR